MHACVKMVFHEKKNLVKCLLCATGSPMVCPACSDPVWKAPLFFKFACRKRRNKKINKLTSADKGPENFANPNAAEFLCETFYVCEFLFRKELLSDISNIFQAVLMNETQKYSLSIHQEKTKLNATHAIPKNLDTGEVNVTLQK